MKKEFILFEEARKSKLLLNGVLSTIISYLMAFVGPLIGGVMLAMTVLMMAITGIMEGLSLTRLDDF